MTRGKSRGWWWLAVCVVVACAGCPRGDGPEQKPGKTDGKAPPATGAAKSGVSEPPKKVEPPPPPTIPKVTMAEGDLATCLVRVGDAMPDAELPDLAGKKVSLRSLAGKKLTVVVFWTGKNMYALQQLQDLEVDVAKPYADKGVALIGIDEGEDAKAAKDNLETAGATFPNLLDPEGAFLAKVAKGRLPRTYLLDAEGKILWFDIEYSRSTRRDLQQAIKVALGELK